MKTIYSLLLLFLFATPLAFSQYQVNLSWTAPTPYWSITGASTTGTFNVGETVTQATSKATGVVLRVPSGPTNPPITMFINSYAGTADATDTWTGNISGATFVPTATPTIPYTVSGYNIFRAVHGTGNYNLVNTSIDTSLAYSDATVIGGNSYDYYVETVDLIQGYSSIPSNVFTTGTIPGGSILINPTTSFTGTLVSQLDLDRYPIPEYLKIPN